MRVKPAMTKGGLALLTHIVILNLIQDLLVCYMVFAIAPEGDPGLRLRLSTYWSARIGSTAYRASIYVIYHKLT